MRRDRDAEAEQAEQAEQARLTGSLAALAAVLALVAAGLFLAHALQGKSAVENCLLAGRITCGAMDR